ncbi:class I SAM-dependent methyltransferase [Candidatus Micrarchaeota archaeon]|nr:class I SAM-dependent methyltransferase [Candidatus Micrarchaeota archaeon]
MIDVGAKYDKIAGEYLKTKTDDTLIFARKLEEQLEPGSRILDAGCGAGIPIAKYLSGKFEVFGIDISAKQIELAKRLVPNAKFKKADMLEPGFENEYFDGIICMYSLIHVDRRKHLEILRKFYELLKTPGYLLVCMHLEESEGEEDYLGTKMFWSGYGRKRNIELLKKCGFTILWEKDWANPRDSNDRHLFLLCGK